jgi:hypothetical protein
MQGTTRLPNQILGLAALLVSATAVSTQQAAAVFLPT